MIFYTSDLHFDHENLLDKENRPFKSVLEMDNFLISQWNARVHKRDDVYILGDVSLKITPEVIRCIDSLNGKIHLVAGNHDRLGLNGMGKYIQDISRLKEIHDEGHRVIMCHYPMASWNAQRFGSIHLYGHVHSMVKLPAIDLSKLANAYNVWCGYYNWGPVTLEELKQRWGYDKDAYLNMPNGGC